MSGFHTAGRECGAIAEYWRLVDKRRVTENLDREDGANRELGSGESGKVIELKWWGDLAWGDNFYIAMVEYTVRGRVNVNRMRLWYNGLDEWGRVGYMTQWLYVRLMGFGWVCGVTGGGIGDRERGWVGEGCGVRKVVVECLQGWITQDAGYRGDGEGGFAILYKKVLSGLEQAEWGRREGGEGGGVGMGGFVGRGRRKGDMRGGGGFCLMIFFCSGLWLEALVASSLRMDALDGHYVRRLLISKWFPKAVSTSPTPPGLPSNSKTHATVHDGSDLSQGMHHEEPCNSDDETEINEQYDPVTSVSSDNQKPKSVQLSNPSDTP
ncbi:hypothetical protein Tco_0661773 [Tanacetum coccineum]